MSNENDSRVGQLSLLNKFIDGYEFVDLDVDQRPIPVGAGGSGIVFKARQYLYETVFVERAVKFFLYRDDIARLTVHKRNGPVSEEDFISEIANITSFNHESLIRVVAAGFYDGQTKHVPYIVTDYVEGPTLKQIIENDGQSKLAQDVREYLILNPDSVLDVLLAISRAIGHIHGRNFAHCDIAPKNVFVNFDGTIKPILGDLGISKTTLKRQGVDSVFVAGSPNWMPESAKAFLNREVSYDVFSKLQPHWDIYSFAKTALCLLDIFGSSKPRSWFEALKKIMSEAQVEGGVDSIFRLIERIEFLKPIHREVANVPELSMGVGAGRRKMMPVEALTTTKRLHELVRHPSILRLSKVPQLTTANQILPGASHTRYEHTLGVIETMRRYILALLDESEFLEHLNVEKIEVALMSAAFSSATRFPLSNVIHELRQKNKSAYLTLSRRNLIRKVLEMPDSRGKNVEEFLEKEYPNVDIENVVRIISGEQELFDDEDILIHTLLNCSLDVRVIDFVRRDAHHLGVISGDSFDLDEMLPHFTVHDHKLAIKITGVSVAEQIISLRYWLFGRVYWNRPNRTFCAMALYAFRGLLLYDDFEVSLAARVLEFDQRGLIEFLIECAELNSDDRIADISRRLLGNEHRLFKVVLEISRSDDFLFSKVIDVLSEMDYSQLDEVSELVADALHNAGLIKRSQDVKEILIDVPVEPGSTKLGEDILVKKNSGEFVPLSAVSGIVRGINESFKDQLTRLRVFVHPDIVVGPRKEFEKIVAATISDFVGKR